MFCVQMVEQEIPFRSKVTTILAYPGVHFFTMHLLIEKQIAYNNHYQNSPNEMKIDNY